MDANNDNNAPEPNPTNGEKTWKNGGYYFGVAHKNTTYNQNFHHFIELEIAGV